MHRTFAKAVADKSVCDSFFLSAPGSAIEETIGGIV
jgi:hypothetical protein